MLYRYMYATGNDFVDTYLLSNYIKTNKQFIMVSNQKIMKRTASTKGYTYIHETLHDEPYCNCSLS